MQYSIVYSTNIQYKTAKSKNIHVIKTSSSLYLFITYISYTKNKFLVLFVISGINFDESFNFQNQIYSSCKDV